MCSFRLSSWAVFAAGALGLASAGCYSTTHTVEPGHLGLFFDPHQGVQKEALKPGTYAVCPPMTRICPRIDDFDVTYSTNKEVIETESQERLPLTLKLAVIYRPIRSELYELDTEIGPNYYDEVVGPEFRSTARGVFSRHSYLELQKKNEGIENEIEKELQRRIQGKHVEVSSVLLEEVNYAPEIAAAMRAKVVSEQEALRLKTQQEMEAARAKRALELQAEHDKLAVETRAAQQKIELEAGAEQLRIKLESEKKNAILAMETEAERKRFEARLSADTQKQQLESALLTKQNERKLAQEQAVIDKLKADGQATAQIAAARGEAESRLLLARASGAEKQAEGMALTPMHVMMHAYDALAHLGGSGTTIMLGDWSKIPNFLFPRVPAFNSAFTLPWSGYMAPPMPQAPAPTSSNAPDVRKDADAVYSSIAPGTRH